ncbi:hypothetical protein F5H01DRAFT_119268 [Linnemannia elongata]|nr:hypothetical protein F5H01DRAFT_119268 [Linnemannia elongata]
MKKTTLLFFFFFFALFCKELVILENNPSICENKTNRKLNRESRQKKRAEKQNKGTLTFKARERWSQKNRGVYVMYDVASICIGIVK